MLSLINCWMWPSRAATASRKSSTCASFTPLLGPKAIKVGQGREAESKVKLVLNRVSGFDPRRFHSRTYDPVSRVAGRPAKPTAGVRLPSGSLVTQQHLPVVQRLRRLAYTQ